MRPGAVAVIVTCYNLGRTIQDAIDSVLCQTCPAAELVIVDDGSDDVYTLQALVHLERAGHRVIRTKNRGVSAASNTGIRLTAAPRILVLDADDILAPPYLEKMCERLDQDPTLDFISCGMQGLGASAYTWCPPVPGLPAALIRGIVHVSSIFRRIVWETVGGFDEAVRRSQDLEFWTRVLEHGFRGDVIKEPLLHYRMRHDSRYHEALGTDANAACMPAFYRKHWHTVAAHAEEMFVGKESFLLEQQAHHAHVLREIEDARREVEEGQSEIVQLQAELDTLGCPAIDLGELRRTSPFSSTWGVDRGKPLDRHYIEGFLDRHRQDVRGWVLEVKDLGYTRMFGDNRVTRSDVVDIDVKNEQATIHEDLARADSIPDDTYDAFILTQTLGLIFDAGAALRHACRILKPGGVLLCTVPAAGRISHEGSGADGDFWRFTEASIRRLFVEVFPVESFEITGFGNVLADSAFLYGLAAHELTPDELGIVDPALPLVYGIRAVKPGRPGDEHARRSASIPCAGHQFASARQTAARRPAGRAVILAYHRVSASLPQGLLVVAAELFQEQMAYVREQCTPMSLGALAEAAYSRQLPARAVAVTFDDGYLDCLTEAAPVLIENGIPATAFVTSQGEEDSNEFYWDLLDRIFAPGRLLPLELDLPSAGVALLATATPSERAAARGRLDELFYAMSGPARAGLSAQLRAWSSLATSRDDHRPLTEAEIRRLGAMPGISIGAHSRHHCCLPIHCEEMQREEVAENRRWLQRVLGHEANAFAYPYGDRDETTVRVVRELGFTIGTTVDELPVENGWPRLLLPRCQARGADITAFATWLDDLLEGGR